MPAKAPIYLKNAGGNKGNKKLREILSTDMISAPLGDFRHTAHVGRGGSRDMFGDTSFIPNQDCLTTILPSQSDATKDEVNGTEHLDETCREETSDRESIFILFKTLNTDFSLLCLYYQLSMPTGRPMFFMLGLPLLPCSDTELVLANSLNLDAYIPVEYYYETFCLSSKLELKKSDLMYLRHHTRSTGNGMTH